MKQHENRIKRDPVQVLHGEILNTPEGIKGAAERIGRSPGILHNKFSESMPHYDITVREGLALAKSLKTRGFVEAICEQFDGVFLHLPEGMAGQDDVLESYLGIIQHMGDLSREFTEARADGVIDPAEFAALRLRANRTVVAIMRLVADLESTVREVPQSPLSIVGKSA